MNMGQQLTLVFIVLTLVLASYNDAIEAEKQNEFYCEMVLEGYWPNYKSINCEGNK